MPFVLFSSCFLLADHKNGYMSYLMVSLVLAQFRSPPASLTSSDVFCCCWHLGQSVILFVGLSEFFGKVVFWKLQIHRRRAASEDFQVVKAKR